MPDQVQCKRRINNQRLQGRDMGLISQSVFAPFPTILGLNLNTEQGKGCSSLWILLLGHQPELFGLKNRSIGKGIILLRLVDARQCRRTSRMVMGKATNGSVQKLKRLKAPLVLTRLSQRDVRTKCCFPNSKQRVEDALLVVSNLFPKPPLFHGCSFESFPLLFPIFSTASPFPTSSLLPCSALFRDVGLPLRQGSLSLSLLLPGGGYREARTAHGHRLGNRAHPRGATRSHHPLPPSQFWVCPPGGGGAEGKRLSLAQRKTKAAAA